jgi:hypothetical protein
VQRLQMEKEDPWADMYRRRQGLTAKQKSGLLAVPAPSGKGKRV